jgi:hypothetical protein
MKSNFKASMLFGMSAIAGSGMCLVVRYCNLNDPNALALLLAFTVAFMGFGLGSLNAVPMNRGR